MVLPCRGEGAASVGRAGVSVPWPRGPPLQPCSPKEKYYERCRWSPSALGRPEGPLHEPSGPRDQRSRLGGLGPPKTRVAALDGRVQRLSSLGPGGGGRTKTGRQAPRGGGKGEFLTRRMWGSRNPSKPLTVGPLQQPPTLGSCTESSGHSHRRRVSPPYSGSSYRDSPHQPPSLSQRDIWRKTKAFPVQGGDTEGDHLPRCRGTGPPHRSSPSFPFLNLPQGPSLGQPLSLGSPGGEGGGAGWTGPQFLPARKDYSLSQAAGVSGTWVHGHGSGISFVIRKRGSRRLLGPKQGSHFFWCFLFRLGAR